MKIYDMLQYDEIDIYLREGDITHGSWLKSQSKLSKWFLSKEFSEEVYLELINMKTFKLQNGKKPSQENLDRLKEFMANYFLDNPNLTEKSFNITIEFLKSTGNFRHNTDTILQSKLATEEEFNYALDNEFLGTDKKTLHEFFHNVQVSENTMKRYIAFEKNDIKFQIVIKKQKLSIDSVHSILNKSDNKDEMVFLMAEYKQPIGTSLFLDTLATYDADEMWENPAKGIKQMILKDRNLIDDVFLWKSIHNFLIKNTTDMTKAIIFQAILTYDNVDESIIEFMSTYKSALEYLADKMDVRKLSKTSNMEIYKLTHIEAFLSDEIKDVFLF